MKSSGTQTGGGRFLARSGFAFPSTAGSKIQLGAPKPAAEVPFFCPLWLCLALWPAWVGAGLDSFQRHRLQTHVTRRVAGAYGLEFASCLANKTIIGQTCCAAAGGTNRSQS